MTVSECPYSFGFLATHIIRLKKLFRIYGGERPVATFDDARLLSGRIETNGPSKASVRERNDQGATHPAAGAYLFLT